MKERKLEFASIICLRACATLLIVNSHLGGLYPQRLKELAFGAMFGDCLFFFISGFCLAETKDKLSTYAIKRIKRIYIPWVLFLPFLFLSGKMPNNAVGLIWPEEYGFITMILMLYLPYYLIILLGRKHGWTFIASAFVIFILQLLYYLIIFLNSGEENSIIYDPIIEPTSYFLAMLLGGIVRKQYRKIVNTGNRIVFIGCLLLSLLGFILQSLFPLTGIWRIIQWHLAIAFAVNLGLCFISWEETLNKKRPEIINNIASITIEVYLLNNYIIAVYENKPIFPIGLICCLISLFAVATVFHSVNDRVNKRIDRFLLH